ncbi:MAG: NUDIX hydrolase [Candidatus Moranbacteria bacterium CG_4_8_14_3_um_filter_34_16]|nr:MAG: NUDIX hydrolase [Candidatus Moranbacteria bacterium CG_4_8_14_3_um_filter_34_16]
MSTKVKKWKELSREIAFQKYGRKIEKVIYRLPDGTESDFYIKKEGPAICVLALTKNNEVILAKQFRPGPNEIILELPGGGTEKGETPEQAIERELLEETGYRGKVKLVTESLDCAYSTMRRKCFVATDCEKISEPQNTSSEICETVLLSLDKFRELLRSGKITDVEVGYLGLDYLGLL